ncbi:MAG: class I SAM-dependent methyltransferase [Desulfuromonadales bacterium]
MRIDDRDRVPEFPVVFRDCPGCGGNDFQPRATGRDWIAQRCTNDWVLVRCVSCGLVYLNPIPAPEALLLIYGNEYGTHRLSETLTSFLTRIRFVLRRRRMGWMRRLLPPGSRLLEVGCGEGFQACLYMKICPSWIVEATDFRVPNPTLLSSNGIRATEGDYDALSFSEPFDFISSCDMLEHVTNQARTVRKLAADLKPRGHLYLELPNPETPLTWLMPSVSGLNVFPEHTAFFTKRQITSLLDQTGFDVLWTRNQASPGAIHSTVVCLIHKYLSASIQLPLTVGPLTVGPCFALEWALSLMGWGSGMTLLARKR